MSCPFFKKNDNAEEEDCVTYGGYLQLNKLLKSQSMRSEEKLPKAIHDEMLFIITHQAFELWFKQILHDMDSVKEILQDQKSADLLTIFNRVYRIKEILRLIKQQFSILETMAPLTFYKFRPFLGTASGFQSVQFRIMEICFGIKEDNRIRHNNAHFSEALTEEERHQVLEHQQKKTLFETVNDWLERFYNEKGFKVAAKIEENIKKLKMSTKKKFEEEQNKKEKNKLEDKIKELEDFAKIFSETNYNAKLEKGERRLTFSAMLGALVIITYKKESIFQTSFLILQELIEIDSIFIKFRYNHALMVQRMLGSQKGTGGSSGYSYLRSTCSDRYRVFLDLIRLSIINFPEELISAL